MEATSTGDRSYLYTNTKYDRSDEYTTHVAAAVLPTGELVCAHIYGVMKVKLSGERY